MDNKKHCSFLPYKGVQKGKTFTFKRYKLVWSQSKPLLDKPVYNLHLLLFPSLPTLINLLLTILSLAIPSIPINFGSIVNFSEPYENHN